MYSVRPFSCLSAWEQLFVPETPAGQCLQVKHLQTVLHSGSTLGSISNTKVALHTVDIGLPQLAMHSAYETAGTKDTAYLIDAMQKFYETSFHAVGDDVIEME